MEAIIAGTSLFSSMLFNNWDEVPVETPYGKVSVYRASQHLFVQRHGKKRVPPHKVPHLANIWALRSLGADGIIAINSVGSLKISLKPGTFIIPDDFVSFCNIPTFFDFETHFTVPQMNVDYAARLNDVCKKLEIETTLGGVYIQTTGPRLETKAEINILKKVGDIVGMTMASEATLCMEYSIPYVSLCSIDNYCNGIIKTPLTIEELEEQILRNTRTVETVIHSILSEGF